MTFTVWDVILASAVATILGMAYATFMTDRGWRLSGDSHHSHKSAGKWYVVMPADKYWRERDELRTLQVTPGGTLERP